MLDWQVALIPPAYVPDPTRPPECAWRAQLAEGEALCALVWGDGGPRTPYLVHLIFEPAAAPEGADPLPSRFPTVEELHAALDAVLPAGVQLHRVPIYSGEPSTRDALYGPVSVICIQVGTQEGSPAAKRSPIHLPHGIGGPRHA